MLSIYEGFFVGGARVLHSNMVAELQSTGRQSHSVLSMHRRIQRETLIQRMEDDACYQMLRTADVPVTALTGALGGTGRDPAIGPAEQAAAARQAMRADVILSLKEQPLRLVNQLDFPDKPVIVCLHRSDPQNQGAALTELLTAVASGRVVAGVCCAEATRSAYQAAGVPGELLHVIPNGVDLGRFRPAGARERGRLRRALGLPRTAAVVVFAARYDPMKNVPLFLEAARRFLTRQRSGQVVMCGAGMSERNPELRHDIETAFANADRLRCRLRLLGPRRDMRAVYASADVVSLTSGVGEAGPLCLIEGTMCGAVPVSTDVGDCSSIVAGRGLVTPADPDAVASAWTEAMDRRIEFASAFADDRERFSQTRMAAAYAALIERTYRECGL
ncbi:glycosyltransferase [Solwaraspora sp. WMMB335]|uniref:glycosyltransferase n=1 Tax=Solwaraspora sp. WMMB335 TaxID=3404118 RepID=UPI003B96466F